MKALQPRDPHSLLWINREKLGLTLIEYNAYIPFTTKGDFYLSGSLNRIVTDSQTVDNYKLPLLVAESRVIACFNIASFNSKEAFEQDLKEGLKILYRSLVNEATSYIDMPEFPQDRGAFGEKTKTPRETVEVKTDSKPHPNRLPEPPMYWDQKRKLCPNCGKHMKRRYWLFGKFNCNYALCGYITMMNDASALREYINKKNKEKAMFIKDLEFELNCIEDLDFNNRSELVNEHLDIIIKICQKGKK